MGFLSTVIDTVARALTTGHIADNSGAHAASAISNTPAGNISATDVQTALNELDTEKTTPAQIQGRTLTAFTTSGTGGAYTLTPTPAITAYAANQEWDVLFHATNTAAPTINISGLGATVNLVRQNYDGTLTNLLAGEIASSTYAKVKLVNTTQAVVLTGLERSGTWTPTLTNTANVAASTAFVCHFSKVGDYVSFFGLVQIDPTTTGATEIGISLPIASNFAATYDAGGTSCSDSFEVGRIFADATNKRLILRFNATVTANASHNFSGGYWIK